MSFHANSTAGFSRGNFNPQMVGSWIISAMFMHHHHHHNIIDHYVRD